MAQSAVEAGAKVWDGKTKNSVGLILARDEKRQRRVMTVAVNVETFHLTAKINLLVALKETPDANKRIYSLGIANAGTKQFLPIHLAQNETF